jgi:hypothetical protein
MKFPEVLGSLFPKKTDTTQVYLSLYLDVHSVAVAFWEMEGNGTYKMLASTHGAVEEDAWEDRADVVDRLLGDLEEKTGHTDVVKAILGLPTTYLTPTGEIRKEVRAEIKTLTRSLELEPIGFVPLHQALIYKMKKDEGVPPSVILLGVNTNAIAITLYKIGSLVDIRDIEKHEDVATSVEQGLKSFTDLEVLPARMLLYGSDEKELEEIKGKLLRHQWTSRVNFLHFPKIEVVSLPMIIESVSLAGASELGVNIGGGDEAKETTPAESLAVSAATIPVAEKMQKNQTLKDVEMAMADSTPPEVAQEREEVSLEVAEAQEAIAEDFAVDEPPTREDANVVMVDAESLGFKKDVDVLEKETQIEEEEEEMEYDLEDDARGKSSPLAALSAIPARLGEFFGRGGRGGNKFALVFAIILVTGILGSLYWFVPKATVTVLQIPQIVEAQESITIDPTATIVDAENKIVPGKKREKSSSGDKTVPVNGKKNVGDPARGTVTIYNKSLSSRSFKKGAILSNGSLQFTLDSDVQVASASENVGSITFGKADVAVTAVAIGTASNLSAGGEFTFKDLSSSNAIARNDKAFAGGTSREVTVVSRADYDAFVKEVSEELVTKAKQELDTSVEGGEKLIDDTIKTTVTEKVFSQEIDEESTQLQGKLTLAVSGIAYADSDIRALLTTIAHDKIPSGYSIYEAQTTIEISKVTVQKDGKITATATMHSTALPVLDVSTLKSALAGKSLKDVESYLRGIQGVGGVEVGFSMSPTKSRLPYNRKNISVKIAVAQ